jgi:uncharacterized protein YecT (DUF1311 family)
MKNAKINVLNILFISIFAFFSVNGQIAIHPIDAEMTNCKAQNSDILGQIECEITAYQKWSLEVDRVYNVLLTQLDNETRLILKEEQLSWTKLRDVHLEFNSKFYSKQGSMILTLLASKKTDFIRQRAVELNSYLVALKK